MTNTWFQRGGPAAQSVPLPLLSLQSSQLITSATLSSWSLQQSPVASSDTLLERWPLRSALPLCPGRLCSSTTTFVHDASLPPPAHVLRLPLLGLLATLAECEWLAKWWPAAAPPAPLPLLLLLPQYRL
jgi:hypothetical protein